MNHLDVLESVQRFRAETTEPDTDHVREARRSFLAAVNQATADRPARSLSWKTRVPLIAGAATALAAALTVGAVVLPGGGPSIDTAAAATLTSAADATAAQPATPQLADGEFWYERSVFYQPALATDDPEMARANPERRGTYEKWVNLDGTMRIVSGNEDDGADAGDIDETYRGEPLRLGTNVGGTLPEVAALPRETQALYDHVEQVTRDIVGNGRPVNVQMFVLVRDLLRESLLPQDLREALYRVAAQIPGVEVTPGVSDQLGRSATAVWMIEDDTDLREQFLIDPATGAPLAERSLAPDGSVSYESAIVQWGPVESIDTRL